jgi:hypothetical protein
MKFFIIFCLIFFINISGNKDHINIHHQLIEPELKNDLNGVYINIDNSTEYLWSQINMWKDICDNITKPVNSGWKVLSWSPLKDAITYATNPFLNAHLCRKDMTFLKNSVANGERDCTMSLITISETCNILNKFNRINFFGNSFIRHVTQGLLMLLSGDLRWGGIQAINRDSNPRYYKDFYDCQCDRQFSNQKECKQNVYDKQQIIIEPHRDGFCSKYLPGFRDIEPFQFHYTSNITNLVIECNKNPNDIRPQLILFQGPVQSHLNILTLDEVIDRLVQPIILKRDTAIKKCKNTKFKLIFTGNGIQNKANDRTFPSQSRDVTLKYNNMMKSYLSKNYPDILILDMFELTRDGSSFDGFHYTSSINIQKATVILKAMDLI